MFTTIKYPEGAGRQFIRFRYPAGETQVRLTPAQMELVKKSEKVQIIARIIDGEVMELLQLISAVRSVNNRKIQLIMPYLPYGRADRRFVPGDCDGLKTFLNAIDSQIGDNDDIVTLDAHSSVGEDLYWSGFYDVSPMPLIETAVDCIMLDAKHPNLGVLLPDEGSRKRYDLSKLFKPEKIFNASKTRSLITGELKGFQVPNSEQLSGLDSLLIVDDLCDGGGTFNGIADALKDENKELYLYVTHGIFSKGTDELLRRYRKIYTTDSFRDLHSQINKERKQFSENVIVLPCLGTILDVLNTRSELYENALQNPDNREPGGTVQPAGNQTSGAGLDSDTFGASLGGVYGNM